ncbi:MAG: hypothetical protein HYX34_05995 [Actinobacteria bacterium]|nr:hypothetical protein [Actinomycetota bacterium]
MWTWAPPSGGLERLEDVPRWVRVWSRTPFVDRWANAWMWRHGGFDVEPPPDRPPAEATGSTDGVGA